MQIVRGKQLVEVDGASLAEGFDRVVVDVGTGDGRFAYALAREHPDAFVIGIDATPQNLREISHKASRKPAKGGLANVAFVVADAAAPPRELYGTAGEVHVVLPWGKLMVGLLRPDADVLTGLTRLAAPGATLHAVLNGEVWSDPVPVEARDLPDPTVDYVNDVLGPEYERMAGIAIDSARDMSPHDAHAIPSTWAKKLGHGRAAPRFVEFGAHFLLLRDVVPADLPALFDLQADRVATDMAGIPSRDQRAFDAQRAELLADPRFVERAVVVGGEVVGHVIRFDRDGRTYVGYIIAREHWGRGIATRALSEFLERHVSERPLHATVAAHNAGSLRVLEKCGFVPAERGEDEVVLRLDR